MATPYRGTGRPSTIGRPSAAGPSRQPVAQAAIVPDYEPLQHPLTPAAQQALNQLQRIHNLEDVKKRLKLANELLAESAGGINDRLTAREKETRKIKREAPGKENAPGASQGGESAGDGESNEADEERREQLREKAEKMEQELEQLRTKVTTMTGRMDDHVRKVVDAQVRAGDITDILTETRTVATAEAMENVEARGTQRRRNRRNDDDDEEMNDIPGTMASFEPTLDGGRTQQPITNPSQLFATKLGQKKDDWQSLSLTTRYTKNNDYIGFKRLVHDAIHGDDGTPLPPPNKWFAEIEGRGSPAPGTQAGTAGAAEDSDDDIAIAREVISTKCPLTLKEFQDPVTSTKCPHTFERSAIKSLIQESTIDFNGNSIRGRRDNRSDKAVNCPVGGCGAMLTVGDLRADPVLVRKIQRLQTAKRRQENEDDEDSDDLLNGPGGRGKGAVNLGSSSVNGDGDERIQRLKTKTEPRSSTHRPPPSTAVSTVIDLSEDEDDL